MTAAAAVDEEEHEGRLREEMVVMMRRREKGDEEQCFRICYPPALASAPSFLRLPAHSHTRSRRGSRREKERHVTSTHLQRHRIFYIIFASHTRQPFPTRLLHELCLRRHLLCSSYSTTPASSVAPAPAAADLFSRPSGVPLVSM